jgi:hypothetical protein
VQNGCRKHEQVCCGGSKLGAWRGKRPDGGLGCGGRVAENSYRYVDLDCDMRREERVHLTRDNRREKTRLATRLTFRSNFVCVMIKFTKACETVVQPACMNMN